MTTPNEFAEQAGLGMWQAYCDKKQQVEALQEEIDRLRTEAVAADIRIANDALVIAGLTAETVRLANKAEAQDRVIQIGREAVVKIATERDALQAKFAALEGAYIPTYLERLAASPATLEAEFTALRSEALDLRAALAERDAKLAALEKQEPMAWLVYGNGSHRYSTLTFDVSQVPDIYVGGDVVALYAAAGAAPKEPTP